MGNSPIADDYRLLDGKEIVEVTGPHYPEEGTIKCKDLNGDFRVYSIADLTAPTPAQLREAGIEPPEATDG